MRHDWLSAWWEAFAGGRRLRICTVRDGDEFVATFPLAARGARLEALANVHTPVFVPLARDSAALSALVAAVLETRPGSLVVWSLPDGAVLFELGRASEEAGRALLVEPKHVSPLVETRDDHESYRRTLDGRRRRELDRLRRKLEGELGAVLALEEPADLEAALDRAFPVEQTGWKGRRGTAIGTAGETEAFYRGVARRFHAHGRVRLATVTVDGKPVAFDLCLLDHGRLWVLKGAYDESLARFGPGMVLTMYEIECCHELGLEALELLGDDEPWKRTFSNAERRHAILRSYRRRPVPLARWGYRRALRPRLARLYHAVRPPGKAGA